MSQVGGMRLEYFRICSDIAQQHYPERTKKYLVINAPSWFSLVWRIIKPQKRYSVSLLSLSEAPETVHETLR